MAAGHRRRTAFLSGLLALALVAAAQGAEQPRKLSGAEIAAALTNRTFVGEWKGKPYRQYFGKGGTTVYQEEGVVPSIGLWRADADKGQYCSQWASGGWDCYDVLGAGPDRIIWAEPRSDYRSPPGEMVDGRQLY